MTQSDKNCIQINNGIHLNVIFQLRAIGLKDKYLQHPGRYTLISALNARNKSILFKLDESIDLIMTFFNNVVPGIQRTLCMIDL